MASPAAGLCVPPAAGTAQARQQLLLQLTALGELAAAGTSGGPDAPLMLSFLPAALRPSAELLPPDGADDAAAPPACLALFQQASETGLSVLERVLSGPSALPAALVPDVAALLMSHTSASDPWTTPTTRALSQRLLAAHAALTAPDTLTHILARVLKPLFAPPAPSAAQRHLTPTARLSARPSARPAPALPPTPPWRHTHPHAPTLLSCALHTLPAAHLEASWPLLLPPILTLLDDTHPPSKTRACTILTALLARLSSLPVPRGGQPLLVRTGLTPVLWSALMPCLLALPPLTPPSHAVPLLGAAYSALIALSGASASVRERKRLLDSLVRDGVLRGMRFGGENAAVAGVLLAALRRIVGLQGVWGVRHLKTVVPVLVDVLGSPFGAMCVPLLAEAVGALREVVRCCWVRVGPWVGEVLRGVCVCWNRIMEEEGEKGEEFAAREDVVGVKEGLREVVGMLRAVVGEEEEGGRERMLGLEKEIVGVDDRLEGLFAV